ncbi:MAG: DUF348 domain-containing protein [Chloroflexi bacterium]|nr:DUF348 domain-containing protein [Chloroflexota bacterium]
MHDHAPATPTHKIMQWSFILVLAFFLTACQPAQTTSQLISVTITADGSQKSTEVTPGSTVSMALEQAGVNITNLDKVDPPAFTAITAPANIRVTRVQEVFEVKEDTIPFTRQTVRNESLPEGETLLIQPGQNGVQQITYRRLMEDGIEVSNTVFKTVVLTEAMPEIVMVGVQTPFMTIAIPGNLAYISNGNAWIMEGSTGDRRPLVTTGDLDGRIFSISPGGDWLLYSRKSDKDPAEEINTLWVISLTEKSPQPVPLRVSNVVHFADWMPGAAMTIVYSTVEPRASAPGWQANNDLYSISIGGNGGILGSSEIIPANIGGLYGWWGTQFFWSPDGSQLAYSRPDSIGLVDMEAAQFLPLVDVLPLQTRSDWAWVPSIGWTQDTSLIYTVTHTPMTGLASPETSPLFDVTAINVDTAQAITIAPQSGMFAYPNPSPYLPGEPAYIAYLQAIFPDQSETSRYHLILMDRDGSNRRTVFPPEGSQGLEPQNIIWSPDGQANNTGVWVAFIYQGNLWILDPQTGESKQITGDGSIGKIDWK